MGNKGRWEYLRAIYERYRVAGRAGKNVILSECCANTGYHRKYAIRLLNGPRPEQRQKAGHRRRRQSYGPEMAGILTAVWEAAGYPWSVRLKAILPAWMPWIRKRFGVRPEIAKQLLKISARQMDRRLRAQKTQRRRRIYGRTKPGYLLKHQIPVKTDSWDVRVPGFTEVDLVSHSRRVGHSILRKFLFDEGARGEDITFVIHRGVKKRGCPTLSARKGGLLRSDAKKAQTSLRKNQPALHHLQLLRMRAALGDANIGDAAEHGEIGCKKKQRK